MKKHYPHLKPDNLNPDSFFFNKDIAITNGMCDGTTIFDITWIDFDGDEHRCEFSSTKQPYETLFKVLKTIYPNAKTVTIEHRRICQYEPAEPKKSSKKK